MTTVNTPPPSLRKWLTYGPAAIALSMSLLLHTGIATSDLGKVKKAQSRTQVELVFAPPASPVEEPELPPEPELDEPKPEPEVQKPKVKKPEPVEQPEPKDPEPKKPVEAPKPEVVKQHKDTEKAEPKGDAAKEAPKGDVQKERKKRQSRDALFRSHRDRQAEMKDRLRQLREARRKAARHAKANQRRSGKKPRGKRGKKGRGKKAKKAAGTGYKKLDPGDPEAVFACTDTDRGQQVHVRAERAMTDWVSLMPTVLMPFETKPSLSDYLEGTGQVVKRYRSGIKRTGRVEFILPQEVLQLEVERPDDVRISVGRLDARCLIGVNFSKQIFPLEMRRAPIRILNTDTLATHDALVNITLYKDASFDIELVDDKAKPLPFTSGRLKNADAIERSIRDHYAAADALKSVAGFFGIDVVKLSRDRRKERLDATRGGSGTSKRAQR